MGVDYRFFMFCEPSVEEKLQLLPETADRMKRMKSALINQKYSFNNDNSHAVIFHRTHNCLMLDTTIRFGSVVCDGLITGIYNDLVMLGVERIYICGDCSLFDDEDDIAYAKTKSVVAKRTDSLIKFMEENL